ncbi:MAG: hypothetical protein HW384_2239, partial [Dehalococcoidia bacterium]|nr:hypothetical protein [Dehalococcoidia bacterium]
SAPINLHSLVILPSLVCRLQVATERYYTTEYELMHKQIPCPVIFHILTQVYQGFQNLNSKGTYVK